MNATHSADEQLENGKYQVSKHDNIKSAFVLHAFLSRWYDRLHVEASSEREKTHLMFS
jgi:hypothetical protein